MSVTDLEVKAAAWTAKHTAMLVAGGIGLAVAILLVVWALNHFIFAPMNAKHDAAVAHGGEVVAGAQSEAAGHASNVVAGNAVKENGVHEKTRTNYVYINKQPGADDPVSEPVFNAFVQSVCMRDSAAGLPDCQRLREADPH